MKKYIAVVMTITMFISTFISAGVSAVPLDELFASNANYTNSEMESYKVLSLDLLPCTLESNSTYQNVFITSTENIDNLKLYTVAYLGGNVVYTKINNVDITIGENNIYTKADLTGVSYDSIKIFLFGSNMRPYMKSSSVSDKAVYTVNYGSKYAYTDAFGDLSIPVAKKGGYKFIGYFDENNFKVTDENGKKLSTYTVTKNFTVTARFERVYSEADTETGELLGNPGSFFYIPDSSYTSTNRERMAARNPWDVTLWNNKLYVGLGNFVNNTDAPPLYYYDLNEEAWNHIDFKTMKYESVDGKYQWHEIESATATDINGSVTTTFDNEISRFRVINDQLYLLGADMTIASNFGNFYTLETDLENNEQWVEYREALLYSYHLYDMMGIDNGGVKQDILYGNGTDLNFKGGAYIHKIGSNNSNTIVQFYDKDGKEVFTKESAAKSYHVYDFFETSSGIYALFATRNADKVDTCYIYKYSSSIDDNGKIIHRFDYLRDYPSIMVAYSQQDTGLNKSKQLNHHMTNADVNFNGNAYITNGYLYKTNDFQTINKITTPDDAIISDLLIKDGKLYALGFVKQEATTNYTNYVWTVDSSDGFTQIREFTSENSYALSFDMDDEFFYVGMGGLSTYSNVGNILRISKDSSIFKNMHTITYGENQTVQSDREGNFTIPVPVKDGYKFIGYFDESGIQVTGEDGKKLSSYTITNDITVTEKFERVYTEADSTTGELLGNPGSLFYIPNSPYSSTNYGRMLARNPWDIALWNDKLYVGMGNYDNNTEAPPLYYYDLNEGEWDHVDFKTMKYESVDGKYQWHEIESATATDINGPVTTTLDHEISRFRVVNDQLYLLGADITVTSNFGNFYTLETDADNNEQWIEYRESTLYSTHLFDMMGIDNGGEKQDLLCGNGTDLNFKGGAYIYKVGSKNINTLVQFYDKNGKEVFTSESTAKFYRVYDFFETVNGIYARLAINNSSGKYEHYIYKYSSSTDASGKITHRFDYVRDYPSTIVAYSHQDTGLNKSKRLSHHFTTADVNFNGYSYIANGNLYKTKDFNTITKITTPNGATISDLLMKDGKLYALGFVKQGSTTNYKNYVWTINSSDKFTQIREFTSENSYALSFDMNDEFFYVGMGGLSTYSNVGNILKLAINPVSK